MIYSIRRFSDDYDYSGQQPEKKGLSTLSKIALGTAAVGGGVLAGRAGMLGTGIQKGIGKYTAKIGNTFGSGSLTRDGFNTYRKGLNTELTNKGISDAQKLLKDGKKLSEAKIKNINSMAENQSYQNAYDDMINKFGINDKNIFDGSDISKEWATKIKRNTTQASNTTNSTAPVAPKKQRRKKNNPAPAPETAKEIRKEKK